MRKAPRVAHLVRAQSPTEAVREFYRRVYRLEEALGDTIEVALGEDGVAHVRVVKRPRLRPYTINVRITGMEPKQ